MSARNTRRNRSVSSVCNSMESLEVRRVPVGNLTATLVNGTLTVTGGDQGESVEISAEANGTVKVTGFDLTLINNKAPVAGRSAVVFNNVTNVDVRTNGGNDVVVFGKNAGQETFNRDITIDTGAGNDDVQIRQVFVKDDLTIRTANGNDKVTIFNSRVGGAGVDSNENDLLVDTARTSGSGEDKDTVFMTNVNVKRDASINTGADNDTVHLFDIRAFIPLFQNQATPVIVGDDLSIDTGDGNDRVVLNRVQVGDELNVDLQSGNDTLTLTRVTADEANLSGGTGTDTLSLLDILFGNLDTAGF